MTILSFYNGNLFTWEDTHYIETQPLCIIYEMYCSLFLMHSCLTFMFILLLSSS